MLSTISGFYSFTFPPNEAGAWSVNGTCIIDCEAIRSKTIRFSVNPYHVDVGYAILIVGRNDGWLSQEYIDLTANRTYETLLKRGFTDERIVYLNPGQHENVDMLTSTDNVSHAINTWAKERVSVDIPLLIYLVDHAKNDDFLLNGLKETLPSSALDSYLDMLTADTGCHDITIIIEACNSGSFIDDLSDAGRIIVTSTGETAISLIETSGATFSKYFFNAISKGKNVKAAFEEASNAPEIIEYPGRPQVPLLDDNGDGVGHTAPLCCGEGALASSTYIGTQFGALDFPPTIVDAVTNKTLHVNEELELWARVVDDSAIKSVYASIFEPDYAIDPISNATMHEMNVTTVELIEKGGDTYTANFIPTKVGRYIVIIHANDEEGNIASPREVVIIVEEEKFDTGSPENPYPSIRGTHRGTIIPSRNVSFSRVYTYSCPGTGGHSEYVAFYEHDTLLAYGTWHGYHSDYHNVTISPSITLLKDHEYTYTIKTGSYPQILHEHSANVTGGIITCIEFIDVNGKKYTNWIPAITLE